jgi:succinate-semialdehyde dehydrogenase/glutarate-semialdehyde dehydrogenase
MDVVRREPRGVVAVITPWNDPYPAAAGLLAAALVTGNTVVHKPSERSAVPGWLLGRLIAAELPPGVLNVVNGDGAVGERLVADSPRPRRGARRLDADRATDRGRCRVARRAGARRERWEGPTARGQRCRPEVGGEQIAVGAFTNSGQLCTSVERVYLHEDLADAVLAELVARAEKLVVGRRTTRPPSSARWSTRSSCTSSRSMSSRRWPPGRAALRRQAARSAR